MLTQNKKFYNSDEDFRQFYFLLKQVACPHCKRIGYLILHGYLYGNDENLHGRTVVRGHRIFCNNRKDRGGCGRTFSVMAADFIKQHSISANSCWSFLKNITKGMSKRQSFLSMKLYSSESNAYRLWNLFSRSQSKIRTYLSRICHPPQYSQSAIPAIKTIIHLQNAFPGSLCPITSFQQYFQRSFL